MSRIGGKSPFTRCEALAGFSWFDLHTAPKPRAGDRRAFPSDFQRCWLLHAVARMRGPFCCGSGSTKNQTAKPRSSVPAAVGRRLGGSVASPCLASLWSRRQEAEAAEVVIAAREQAGDALTRRDDSDKSPEEAKGRHERQRCTVEALRRCTLAAAQVFWGSGAPPTAKRASPTATPSMPSVLLH